MTYFKYDDDSEVYSTDDLENFLMDVVDDQCFDIHINYNVDEVDVLGYGFEPSEVLKTMDERAYYDEKREWCRSLACDNLDLLNQVEVGGTYSFDDCDVTVTVCNEDGTTEPQAPILVLPAEFSVDAVDNNLLKVSFTMENGEKNRMLISKERLTELFIRGMSAFKG